MSQAVEPKGQIKADSTAEGSSSQFALPSHLLKSKLRPWVIIGTFILFALIIIAPTPDGLSRVGQNAIAIFVLCLIFWVSNAIPLMITSMLAIILLPLLNVMEAKAAYALFGNQAVFFILGAFILASAVMQSGLSLRIALRLLQYFQATRQRLLFGLLVLPAGLSMVMSEHAVAAMMFPVVLEMCVVLKFEPGNRSALTMMLAMTWGCIIGGIGTFLGGARAVLAVGILEETTGISIGFLEWALAAIPIVILMLGVAYLLLLFISRHEPKTFSGARELLQQKLTNLGKRTRRETYVGLLMIITILAWATVGHYFGLANIALAAVVVAFIFKLLSWKQVEKDVNWGIILMYGGAIALGFALDQSGAASWLTQLILGDGVMTGIFLVFILAVIGTVLTEGISNSAVVALMMPIAIALAAQNGVDVRTATLALAIPSGLAFMLPISTPATAIAVSSKYVTARNTMSTGIILNSVAIGLFVLAALLYWPSIGFTV
ncbi:MAG: anion transporter [Candidatus Kerfeldbacteria bacterium CG_4_9_14_3_um_filter_45_8]|nr:MAG: anion transporter [Candidatus Kerfeldbacteria bacterium CG_4_9_14_3_um_filter_45_8]